MTTLAGIWAIGGAPTSSTELLPMFAAQARYAKLPPESVATANAAVGRALYPLLAEDRHDIGPQITRDGRTLCVADVRLDNRAALAAAMGMGPVAQYCDAAIVLAAWQTWGCDCFDRLRGDFAVAIVDGVNQRLILARDFLGQRPLFFHRGEDMIGFASMPSGLLALPVVPGQIDEQKLADYLQLVATTATASFFAGISPVPPGHWLAFCAEGMAQHRYWNPPLTANAGGDQATRTAAARRLFNDAVAACLRDASNVGSHLSGGFDSGAVCVASARQLAAGQSLHAYTAALPDGFAMADPRGRFIDEVPLAKTSADQSTNIIHRAVAPGANDFSARWDDLVALFQCPLPNPCNYRWAVAINDAARDDKVATLLTGQMGNLSISFQLAHAMASEAQGGMPHWRRVIRPMARWLGDKARAVWQGGSVPSFAATGAPPPPIDHAASALKTSQAARIAALSRFDFGTFNKGTLAGWGIDLRDPTANRDLVDYCLSLPDSDFVDDTQDRALARRAFVNLLPPAVLNETRRGLQSADWRWAMVREKAALLRQLDQADAVAQARKLIDLPRLRRKISRLSDSATPSPGDETMLRRGALRALAAAHFLVQAARLFAEGPLAQPGDGGEKIA